MSKFTVAPCEGFQGPCENLGAKEQACRTAYVDKTRNTRPVLCEECASAYHEHWDDMWAEYWGSRF